MTFTGYSERKIRGRVVGLCVLLMVGHYVVMLLVYYVSSVFFLVKHIL